MKFLFCLAVFFMTNSVFAENKCSTDFTENELNLAMRMRSPYSPSLLNGITAGLAGGTAGAGLGFISSIIRENGKLDAQAKETIEKALQARREMRAGFEIALKNNSELKMTGTTKYMIEKYFPRDLEQIKAFVNRFNSEFSSFDQAAKTINELEGRNSLSNQKLKEEIRNKVIPELQKSMETIAQSNNGTNKVVVSAHQRAGIEELNKLVNEPNIKSGVLLKELRKRIAEIRLNLAQTKAIMSFNNNIHELLTNKTTALELAQRQKINSSIHEDGRSGKAIRTTGGTMAGGIAGTALGVAANEAAKSMASSQLKSINKKCGVEDKESEPLFVFDSSCKQLSLTEFARDAIESDPTQFLKKAKNSENICNALLNDLYAKIEKMEKLAIRLNPPRCDGNSVYISGSVQGREISGVLTKKNSFGRTQVEYTAYTVKNNRDKKGKFAVPLNLKEDKSYFDLQAGPIAHEDSNISSVLNTQSVGSQKSANSVDWVEYIEKNANCTIADNFENNPSQNQQKMCAIGSHMALVLFGSIPGLESCNQKDQNKISSSEAGAK